MAYLDENGLARLWTHIQAKISDNIVKRSVITLNANKWGATSTSGPFFQCFSVSTDEEANLKLTTEQEAALSQAGISMSVSNSNGLLTFTATGNQPSTDYTVKVEFGVPFNDVPYVGIDSVLNNNSWDTIKAIAEKGIGANYWSVGDRKAAVLNGTCGSRTFSNETYYVYILGFNHNSSREGNGIHFQFGFTDLSGGVNICFTDSYYNSTSSSAVFHMNSSNTNSGGWSSSYMRQTICPSFLNCLPTELKNVISNTTKYTDNTGGGRNTASYVSSTTDKIFLLAEYEVFGSRSQANSAEQNYQAQYAYYSNGNSKIKYNDSDTSSAALYWLRSPSSGLSGNFCVVITDGSVGTNSAHYSISFAPGFRIG